MLSAFIHDKITKNSLLEAVRCVQCTNVLRSRSLILGNEKQLQNYYSVLQNYEELKLNRVKQDEVKSR